MKNGFRLVDGSVWTILSYTSTDEYIDKHDSTVFPSNVIDIVGVKWDRRDSCTHPYNANFSDCFFENFQANDPRIESIVLDVFSYEDD